MHTSKAGLVPNVSQLTIIERSSQNDEGGGQHRPIWGLLGTAFSARRYEAEGEDVCLAGLTAVIPPRIVSTMKTAISLP